MGKSGGTTGCDKHLKKLYHRGHWRPNEDTKLQYLIDRYGSRNWNFVAEELQGRSGRSCRLRWFNQLHPKINKKPLTKEEEERLLSMNGLHGNKWSLIARHFPCKTDNALKNHWHVIMARNQRERTRLFSKRPNYFQQLPPLHPPLSIFNLVRSHAPKNGSLGNSSSSRPSSWVFSEMNHSSSPTPSWTSSDSLWSTNTSSNNSKQEDRTLVPYCTLSSYGLPRFVPAMFSCLDAHASCSAQINQDNNQKEEDQYNDQDQDNEAFEGKRIHYIDFLGVHGK